MVVPAAEPVNVTVQFPFVSMQLVDVGVVEPVVVKMTVPVG